MNQRLVIPEVPTETGADPDGRAATRGYDRWFDGRWGRYAVAVTVLEFVADPED